LRLQRLQLIGGQARVNDENKYGGRRGCVGGTHYELGGDVGVLLIGGRQWVPLITESASPKLGIGVHVTVGVKDSAALPAHVRITRDPSKPFHDAQWGVETSQRHDEFRQGLLVGGYVLLHWH
jgi:hypothetical protein